MALPTTTWTDEVLRDNTGFVEPGFVEDQPGFVHEDAYVPEDLPTTSWTDE